MRGFAVVVAFLVVGFVVAGAAVGQLPEPVGLVAEENYPGPVGPASYVAEPPHCQLMRLLEEKVGGFLQHRSPPGLELLPPAGGDPWLCQPYSLG